MALTLFFTDVHVIGLYDTKIEAPADISVEAMTLGS